MRNLEPGCLRQDWTRSEKPRIGSGGFECYEA